MLLDFLLGGGVGASGALLGIVMEEKTSNKSFNGMVDGHPALLRANHMFSDRPEFNNSEAHRHGASQGGVFRREGATQGIPGVAGSSVPKTPKTPKEKFTSSRAERRAFLTKGWTGAREARASDEW